MLFSALPAFSQLYIKPHQDNSSYLFVEGGLLFVEKGIELQINPSIESKASIYLRNEGQLVQGNSNSLNTGNGLISVFQEGVASAYTYNYWSLPVEKTSGSEKILFEPLDKLKSVEAHFTSDLNGRSNPLTIAERWIYKFAGTGYSDWTYLGKSFDLLPGEGYTMKGVDGTDFETELYGKPNNPGNQQRYDFRGKPGNGSIKLPVEEGRTKLIGNPYPSAIDLNMFLQENTATTGIAYFWDSALVDSHYIEDYEGGYGAYSPAGGNNGYVPAVFHNFDSGGNFAAETGETGGYYSRRYTPIAQGFLVLGSQNGNVNFKNEYRVFKKENPSQSEFKQAEELVQPHFRMNISFGNKYVRQLLLILDPEATVEVDHAKDAENLSALNSDGGWLLQDENYLINVLPIIEGMEIPLFLKVAEPMEVVFHKINPSPQIPALYLFDSEENLYHDLMEKDFAKHLSAGNYSGRFKITFRNGKISPNPETPAIPPQLKIIHNKPQEFFEIFIPDSRKINSIFLFDALGKKIKEIPPEKDSNITRFSTENLSVGVYFIKITGVEGPLFSKKVIISK